MAPPIQGVPAAPGAGAGRARILRSPADVRNVVAGDVLICPTASTAWAAAFPLARALVTDAGGALSRAATIARELRIPAVVGAGDATVSIRDGDMVRVLGDEGVVEIVRNPGATRTPARRKGARRSAHDGTHRSVGSDRVWTAGRRCRTARRSL